MLLTMHAKSKKGRELLFELLLCILIYIAGIFLVIIFQAYFFSIGLFFAATLFIIPTLVELKKEYDKFVKQYKKSRRKTKTVIIGGLPSEKKRKETTTIKRSFFAPVEKAHAKGEVMRELGLFYDSKIQRGKEGEKEIITKVKERIETKEQKEAFFKDLFDALEEKKRINITYQTHYKGYRGKGILKEVKHLVKLLGKEGEIEVVEKGKGGVIIKK